MALPQVSEVRTREINRNILENRLLQNHVAQMLEIWYVALPNGPLPSSDQGVVVSNHRNTQKKYLKIFFFRTAWHRCLKFGMKHDVVVLYQICSNEDPRVQDSPRHWSEVQTIEIHKMFKNLFL